MSWIWTPKYNNNTDNNTDNTNDENNDGNCNILFRVINSYIATNDKQPNNGLCMVTYMQVATKTIFIIGSFTTSNNSVGIVVSDNIYIIKIIATMLEKSNFTMDDLFLKFTIILIL